MLFDNIIFFGMIFLFIKQFFEPFEVNYVYDKLTVLISGILLIASEIVLEYLSLYL